jgi:predicted GIY-YIG superfamily endonuclease
MAFFVYILRCADGSYYTGQTNNLEQRVAMHEAGLSGGYTHSRRPVTLAWHQDFPTREEAVACERQIKRWSRAKKAALAAGDWATISLLARTRGSTGSPRTGDGGPREIGSPPRRRSGQA